MKFWVIKKRYLLAAMGMLLALTIFCAVNVPSAVTASVATRQLPIYCVDRDDKMISISFDAAWGDVILRQVCLCLGQEDYTGHLRWDTKIGDLSQPPRNTQVLRQNNIPKADIICNRDSILL